MAWTAYKTKVVHRFCRRERISDETLLTLLDELSGGDPDASLGGGLVKVRLARPGEGKRDGYRLIIAYRRGEDIFFLRAYAKNEMANLSREDLISVRADARDLRSAAPESIALGVEQGTLVPLSVTD